MDREQEILNLIDEKKKLLEDIKNELYSLDFELHKIEKEKVLKKFKIGDIIVRKDIYIFELTDIDVGLGYARTDKAISLKISKKLNFEIQPQPVYKLSELLEHGRLANKEEIERFNKEFEK